MFSSEGYQALRNGIALVRRVDLGVLGVNGRDRLTWLQGLLTNDVAALPIGGTCEAAYLTPQGRMITDMRVTQFANRTLLEVPASLAAALQRKLDGLLFSEDAQVEDLSDSLTVVDFFGPYRPTPHPHVSATRYGRPSTTTFVASHAVDAVVSEWTATGVTETTLDTLDAVRVEAGVPKFLVDMGEHTIPLEAGLEQRAISFTKGCYVGQEVVIRVMHRGQGRVAKKLVGLSLGSPELSRLPIDVTVAGKVIGALSSAVWSPTLGQSVGLATLQRDYVRPGTKVDIVAVAGIITAEVATLPFL
ncbi:MAG TPA: glycine cleavage T C-terminal barrel domain-containing protein [Vicinamibacterales bacterium]|nr:glycine cleavage T C-terminal barrel domain-containing protein [Vicinamibacterales bacterium]